MGGHVLTLASPLEVDGVWAARRGLPTASGTAASGVWLYRMLPVQVPCATVAPGRRSSHRSGARRRGGRWTGRTPHGPSPLQPHHTQPPFPEKHTILCTAEGCRGWGRESTWHPPASPPFAREEWQRTPPTHQDPGPREARRSSPPAPLPCEVEGAPSSLLVNGKTSPNLPAPQPCVGGCGVGRPRRPRPRGVRSPVDGEGPSKKPQRGVEWGGGAAQPARWWGAARGVARRLRPPVLDAAVPRRAHAARPHDRRRHTPRRSPLVGAGSSPFLPPPRVVLLPRRQGGGGWEGLVLGRELLPDGCARGGA